MTHQQRVAEYPTFQEWLIYGLAEAIQEGVDAAVQALIHMRTMYAVEHPYLTFNTDAVLQDNGVTAEFHAMVKIALAKAESEPAAS